MKNNTAMFIIVAFSWFVIGYAAGVVISNEQNAQKAIKAGVAYYDTDKETGTAVFKYKEIK